MPLLAMDLPRTPRNWKMKRIGQTILKACSKKWMQLLARELEEEYVFILTWLAGWKKVEINPTIAFSPMYSTILPKVFAEFAIASRILKNLSNSFLNSSLSMTLIP